MTLDINLGDGATVVTAELDLERNADSPGEDLFLDGEELKLFRVYARDGKGEVTQLQVTVAGGHAEDKAGVCLCDSFVFLVCQ